MLKLSLVVPDATVNYIENPHCRYDTTGYNAAGATLTRTLDYARFGITSCKVVTAGSALREGVYYRVNTLSGLSGPVTVSAYVIGTGSVRIRLIDNPSGKEWSAVNVTLRADRWVRVMVSGVVTGSNDVRLYVETNEGSAKARTFYVGGLQMERKAYMTTFCDGEQPGCRWNGLYHGSTSQRSGETRAGGRWVVIGGPEREEQDLYMTVIGGLGAAPMMNNTQSYALDAGGYFQNKKVNERIIALTFHAKHKVENAENVVSLAALHQLRQLLLDVVKPDRTGGDEEILFEYDAGDIPLYFRARYDGGLEGDWDIRNQWVNSFPLRLLAVSPFLSEDQQVVTQLDFQETIPINYMLGRINGRWNNMNFGVNGIVQASALGNRGQIYICGYFTVINYKASAVDPMIPGRVAYWNGDQWVAIATSVTGGSSQVATIAVAPNGNVIVGGNFTAINGVAATNIAMYNISTGTWSAFGAGTNGTVGAIAIAANNFVYIGGSFTTAGGVACARIAYWDGLQFRRLGQFGGLDANVSAIAIEKDNSYLYVGGAFLRENGVSADPDTDLNYIAKYNISTGLFQRMNEGFSTTISATVSVYTIIIGNNNVIYAGGHFTRSGTTVLQNIAMWNNSVWVSLGSGLGAGVGTGSRGEPVQGLALDRNGMLLAVGEFNVSGSFPMQKISLWNGSTWLNWDITLAGTTVGLVSSCLVNSADDIFITLQATLPTDYPILNAGITVVTNRGTADAKPTIYVLGSGLLTYIENQTTKKRLYLNLTILPNEEVFLDFSKSIFYSTIRGSLLSTLMKSSDFGTFSLLPGENRLSCFMTNDVSAQMTIQFTPRHWSADATQNVESL